MGATESKVLFDSVDWSNVQYEPIADIVNQKDMFRYVKWETVPEKIKTYMKEHVAENYNHQLAINNFNPYIFIPKYVEYNEEYKIAILYSHAILEYLNDIKMDIPFTLSVRSGYGAGWCIHRIYNAHK